ncbi:T9SS type A sorting domain-containing protein [Winogradskyella pacifica]
MYLYTRETEQIRVDQFESGIYVLKIYSEKGEITKKIVIK